METAMERWYRVTKARFSVRSYAADPGKEQLAALKKTASGLSARGISIEVVRDEAVFTGMFGAKIKGTGTFAAIISRGARPETAGYIGEAFVLEATALGLGTCWLGANFSKSGIKRAVPLAHDEKLVCVISIGVGAEDYAARKRRTIEELTEIPKAEFDALPEWKRCAIECARRAPSAVNTQPWSFDPTGEGIAVENVAWNFGWGRLDCGIAMLHIELGAAHCGVFGEWREDKTINAFVPQRGA
ncbi:MAG TPA: nitroreductase family protein [Clostridia bacterium]|nr:nitroreductase family protein [Clostridia bacterium]